MIKLTDIYKNYRHNGEIVQVLANINLSVEEGECLCIAMPSGVGKTTLLNIIGGMVAPSRGSVRVRSMELTRLPHHFLSQYRLNQVGFIFQQFNLLANFTVLENLYFPLVPTGKPLKSEKKRLLDLLERLKIRHRAGFNVNLLSGGEQQRVAVARALVNEPDIIIADEPFSNLDQENTHFILQIFQELKNAGKTFVLSATTSLNDLRQGFIDREMVTW